MPGRNSLQHADGHHSLISWGFVIHGAIDGYSKQIVYLHCSTNNKKETVLKLFEEVITDYGAPSRIWIDKRGENTLISKIMAEIRGNGRRSFLASSSVHNQRTERLWRECSLLYILYMFQAMEVQCKRKFKKPNMERVTPSFRITSYFLLFPILYLHL